MHTYRTLSTLLVISAMTSVYAAPLNPDDWEVIGGSEAKDCFTFTDGKLYASGNTGGKELFYKVNEGTNPMVNGSGLSITLQFDNDTFLNESETEFQIIFHTNNSELDGGGSDFFHRLRIWNYSGSLNIYDDSSYNLSTSFDITHSLSVNDTTTIEVDYLIKENEMYCSYTLNGIVSDEYKLNTQELNPDLDWRPCFGLSKTDGHSYTVTDVTFIPVSVPEPTAATLSMLALAGVAARRRRK